MERPFAGLQAIGVDDEIGVPDGGLDGIQADFRAVLMDERAIDADRLAVGADLQAEGEGLSGRGHPGEVRLHHERGLHFEVAGAVGGGEDKPSPLVLLMEAGCEARPFSGTGTQSRNVPSRPVWSFAG